MSDIKDELAEAREARRQMVAQANDFIRHVRIHLTAQEQNMLYFFISKVRPKDKNFLRIMFSVKEFCKVCGMDYNGKNNRDIKKALKSLADKSAWAELEEGAETLIRWVDTYTIWQDSGAMVAVLSQSLEPFLLRLIEKGNYTQAELVTFLAMRSMYSKRLYEILKSYQHKSYGLTVKEFELDRLKELLNAEKYERYPDFRRKVLEIAMMEINECTDIEVSYTALKTGRKYDKISFSIQRKQPVERHAAYTLAETKLDT